MTANFFTMPADDVNDFPSARDLQWVARAGVRTRRVNVDLQE